MTTVCLPSADARELVGDLPAEVSTLVWDGTGVAPDGVADIAFLVPPYISQPITSDVLAGMPQLRVIQLLSAGVEPWLPLVPEGVTLCNGRGIHGASTAELALAGMLAVLREMPKFARMQAEHVWGSGGTDGLAGKRVLVLGAGDIGTRVAEAVRIFDAEATLVARRERDGVQPMSALMSLLPEHQIVVIALPHTPETHHLVDAQFLAAMPGGALFVNIARGSIVDTDALVSELMAKRLHAFLDVTDPEPLPADHPLWGAPNLVLTPHAAGGTTGWRKRAYRLVHEQIERFVRGEPLHNVVSAGY